MASAVVEGGAAVRDLGLLASAVDRPRASAFGEDAYRTLPEKVASLMHSWARNHALVDGNKRLAWAAARVFCLLNADDLAYPVDDAEQMVTAVARGEIDVPQLAADLALQMPTALRSP